ncbi:MAG: hypothetical protein ABI813_09580 [Bacteroidota bacterium]
MRRNASKIFALLYGIVFLLSLATDWYASLIMPLCAIIIFSILYKLGNGIILREIIALHSVFICLVAPLAGYAFYTSDNSLSRLFVKYMPVPANIYFPFAMPAIAGFVFAICLPFSQKGANDEGNFIIDRFKQIKGILANQGNTALYLLIWGVFCSFMAPFAPESLRFFITLFFWASFAAILYIYFSTTLPYRRPALIVFTIFIFLQAVQQGMFTVVAYMGMTIFSFVFLGKHSGMFKKLTIFTVSLFALLLIQSIKNVYRDYTWRGKKGVVESKTLLFTHLISEKLNDPSDLFTQKAMFPIYMRTNQGFNVALVMRRFPSVKKFDNGDNLLLSLGASLVPRFLWPDKPEAGGKYNMFYYTGFIIRGWSTNVGPLGEAYGSFGPLGGIVYMFFLGLFIRWAYLKVFQVSRKMPLIIFWLPLLFFQVSYSAENDTLQILNSLTKGVLFIYILYKIFPSIYIPRKKQVAKKQTVVYS